eukprot:517748-Rhodomonas_salina.1
MARKMRSTVESSLGDQLRSIRRKMASAVLYVLNSRTRLAGHGLSGPTGDITYENPLWVPSGNAIGRSGAKTYSPTLCSDGTLGTKSMKVGLAEEEGESSENSPSVESPPSSAAEGTTFCLFPSSTPSFSLLMSASGSRFKGIIGFSGSPSTTHSDVFPISVHRPPVHRHLQKRFCCA